jgi:hypothetical protein
VGANVMSSRTYERVTRARVAYEAAYVEYAKLSISIGNDETVEAAKKRLDAAERELTDAEQLAMLQRHKENKAKT